MKQLTSALIAFACVFMMTLPASAVTPPPPLEGTTIGDFRYVFHEGEAFLTNLVGTKTCFKEGQKEVTVPAFIEYEGTTYPVCGFYKDYIEDLIEMTLESSNRCVLPEILNLPASCSRMYVTEHVKILQNKEYVYENSSFMRPLFSRDDNPYKSDDERYTLYLSDKNSKAVNYLPAEDGTPGDYTSVNGVVYNSATTTLVYVPYAAESVVLAESLETIPARFCAYYDNLREVVWYNSIKKIEIKAFAECDNLVSIKVADSSGGTEAPQSVRAGLTPAQGEIENYAFEGCDALREIEIPAGIQNIKEDAFKSDTALEYVNLGMVETFATTLFDDCPNINEFAASPYSKKYESFDGILYTKGLTELVMTPVSIENFTTPPALKKIGDKAFIRCKKLKSITLNEGLESIGYAAFYDLPSLSEITLPESLIMLGDWAFGMSARNGVYRKIKFGNKLPVIPAQCFIRNNISSINWPGYLYKISEQAFYQTYFSEGVSFDFPRSLTSVGDYAFDTSGFTNPRVKTLKIMGITNIGKNAFTSLLPEEIYCAAMTPPACQNTSFNETTYAKSKVYVPLEAEDDYNWAPGWYNFTHIIGRDYSGVEEVAADADKAVSINGDALTIEIAPEVEVAVYATDGRLIYSGYGACSLTPGRGIFIVRIGTRTCKVIL